MTSGDDWYQERWARVLTAAAERYGTPCYVTAWGPVAAARTCVDALGDPALPVRSWLSIKTHPVAPLVKRWLSEGRGVEVVSEREFLMARSLGATVEQVLVNGPAKHAWLPSRSCPGLRVHLDSIGEADALLPIAARDRWRLGLRCHAPDERDARDPRFAGPFGLTAGEAVDVLGRARAAGVQVESMHFHLGQHAQQPDAWLRGVEHIGRICAAAHLTPRYLDLGGGVPTGAAAEAALRGVARAIARAREIFGAGLEEIWLENGRFVTESSAALVVRVLDVKPRDDSRYLICDGGRTNHALAADRGPHRMLLMPARQGAPTLTTICGPTCMTDDVLARLPLPADIAVGDVIAWLDAGAYHLPWETRFSHGLCAVVWCDEHGQLQLARERERPDLWSEPWISSAA